MLKRLNLQGDPSADARRIAPAGRRLFFVLGA